MNTKELLKYYKPNTRPHSVYIGDTAFGDSGKGIVTAEFNRSFAEEFGQVVSLRVNGGGNAGHSMVIDGVPFVCNQLPSAVAQENAVAVMTRGMVINPIDLVNEIERTKKTFGGRLPGQLLIDERAPLVLPSHKLEDNIPGSTGQGIAGAYADFYSRQEKTIKDLYQEGISGLEEATEYLRPYIHPGIGRFLANNWNNSDVPFTIEEAQGPGLDPYFGIRPDVTSSRPTVRNVHDGTYGVIYAEDLALKVGVTKSVYMSSVGTRRLPETMPENEARYFHNEFDEFGKTTGRKRDIAYISLPILQGLKRFAGYDYLVATHMDAVNDKPIKAVVSYWGAFGNRLPYSFYQDEMDRVVQTATVSFDGWSGVDVKQAKSKQELPETAREYLDWLSDKVAPVMMIRFGKNLGDNLVL